MRRLKKIKIGGHKVEVKSYPAKEMGGLMGQSWNAHNIIRLNLDYPVSRQEGVLLHEVLHHCMENLGYKYDKNSATAIHSEQTVEALAQSLYQVFIDNQLNFTGKIEDD